MEKRNLDFTAVHDSFWTHARNIDELLRDSYVKWQNINRMHNSGTFMRQPVLLHLFCFILDWVELTDLFLTFTHSFVSFYDIGIFWLFPSYFFCCLFLWSWWFRFMFWINFPTFLVRWFFWYMERAEYKCTPEKSQKMLPRTLTAGSIIS